jgi:flagellin-like protein
MKQIDFHLNICKMASKKRRGVAEVISTLLLVVITVVGAVVLTGFIDETFVAGSQSVISGTDTTIKTIKLRAFDTRDGDDLMGYGLNNRNSMTVINVLCRESCSASPNTNPTSDGSDFIVIQIENQAVGSIFLKNIYLDKVNHPWDPNTASQTLDETAMTSSGGVFPLDGRFSIIPADSGSTQKSNEIKGGEIVNLIIKLDTVNEDIDLSKTMRVQLNIGKNSLSEFLIESGGAQ